MASNHSKKNVDIFDNLLYGSNTEEQPPVQTRLDIDIIETMLYGNFTMREALEIQFRAANVDTNSVFAITDYLEHETGSLNKTWYLMQIYNGDVPDVYLTPTRKKDDE
jgi:hypothetical protein